MSAQKPGATTQQNEGSEGFIDTVKSYIPGLSPQHTNTNASSGSQGGILSYIPGFGGSTVANDTTNEGKANTAADAGEVSSPIKSDTQTTGAQKTETNTSPRPSATKQSGESTGAPVGSSAQDKKEPVNAYDSSYQGVGTGSKYNSGPDKNAPNQTGHNYSSAAGSNQTGKEADTPTAGQNYKSGNNDSLAQREGQDQGSGGHSGQNQGSGNYKGQQQGSTDDGVRGAPIEGEGVKGYAVSAPVGSGDTNDINPNGDPSGQVSGAHMQYQPEDTDTRDSYGRGTVGRTKGEGDSSFANVKRNIPYGTEHVVTKSSQSHIEHTSTTQL